MTVSITLKDNDALTLLSLVRLRLELSLVVSPQTIGLTRVRSALECALLMCDCHRPPPVRWEETNARRQAMKDTARHE